MSTVRWGIGVEVSGARTLNSHVTDGLAQPIHDGGPVESIQLYAVRGEVAAVGCREWQLHVEPTRSFGFLVGILCMSDGGV